MTEPSWWLDERGHAGAEHLDPEYVAGYDAKSGTEWGDEIEALLSLGVEGRSTVVDIGAGTGTFALSIAPHVARVIGVDVSDAMVETMRARGVEAVQAGFLSYDHTGDLADAVFTRNALHHLPDFWKAVALMRIGRFLRPGGVLLLHDLIYSFEPEEAGSVISSWIADAPTEHVDGWTGAELAEHVRGGYSTFSWLLEPMLEHAGFEIRDRRLSDSRTYASYTCVRSS